MPTANTLSKPDRNEWLDFLKGTAIISVVLYHLGIFPYGYLGVDLFLAIHGFLVTKSALSAKERGEFAYFPFLIKRVTRLWPLLLAGGALSLAIGFFTMLPDDFENLAESVVASNLFANNILAAVTTKDYWGIAQQYKSLMHTWYLGIVVQFYAVWFLLVALVGRFAKNIRKMLFVSALILTGLSLALYVTQGGGGAHFYLLQYRFFELSAGAAFACGQPSFAGRHSDDGQHSGSREPKLTAGRSRVPPGPLKGVAAIGRASYSIYIWHQIAFAFYRYIFRAQLGAVDMCVCLLLAGGLSACSYFWLEKVLQKRMLRGRTGIFACLLTCVVSTALAGVVYLRAGVVRDVPELDIETEHVQRGMHAAYCDRVYAMNKPFQDDGRIKVLAFGNSFVRDWVNVLLESDMTDRLDIVYIFDSDLSEEDIPRIAEADYIFVNAGRKGLIPGYMEENRKPSSEIWGVGIKEYGRSNGNVYNRRFSADYRDLTASFADVAGEYEDERAYWGDKYVDFISPILREDGRVAVFTDDGKYISQDCQHLTRSGAKYYAKILDLNGIFR